MSWFVEGLIKVTIPALDIIRLSMQEYVAGIIKAGIFNELAWADDVNIGFYECCETRGGNNMDVTAEVQIKITTIPKNVLDICNGNAKEAVSMILTEGIKNIGYRCDILDLKVDSVGGDDNE